MAPVSHNLYGNDPTTGAPRRSVVRMRKGLCPDPVYVGTSYNCHPQVVCAPCPPPMYCPPTYCAPPVYCPPAHCPPSHCAPVYSPCPGDFGADGAHRGLVAAQNAAAAVDHIKSREAIRTMNTVQCGGYEVVPRQGVTYPRTSIGLGHPPGPLSQHVQGQYQGAADLSPLLPGRIPPKEFVVNPSDGDHFHRTSVYAASGVPIDMPAYSGAQTWNARMHYQRP